MGWKKEKAHYLQAFSPSLLLSCSGVSCSALPGLPCHNGVKLPLSGLCLLFGDNEAKRNKNIMCVVLRYELFEKE